MAETKRKRIAFCYFHPPGEMPSYVARDMAILEDVAEVEWIRSQPLPAWRRYRGPSGWLPSVATTRAIAGCDMVFQWFASPSACVVAGRLLRKPTVVVTGGFDVASEPEIGYGRRVHPLSRQMARLTLGSANRVLAVSEFNAGEARSCVRDDKVEVVPHGFEPVPPPAPERTERVVSLGAISPDYMVRKGLEDFARASTALPDLEFVLAGAHVQADLVDRLRSLGGPNLHLPGFISDEERAELLGTSAVYLQLSRHEAFGCAIAEAMLHGCTPVLSRTAAMPEVAGDVAYYVDSREPADVGEAIGRAMRGLHPLEAHERISTRYPLAARRRSIQTVVEEAIEQ